jgi:pimeloyl-ACP methyl ester carboxylesterase
VTALVLVHAFPLSAAMWDAVREPLAAHECVRELVTPELPGFGGRPALSGPPSLDAVADDLAAQLDERGLRRVALGGLSMGGYVAMAFLRRYGDRVDGLVLADTKAGADPEPARENRERIARTVLEERSPRVLLDDVAPGLLGPTTFATRPEVVERVRTLVSASDPEGVAWAQRAMAARPDSFDTLREAEVPALVVVGDEDGLSPVSDAEAMVAALPDASLAVLQGSGHLSALEVPEAFTAALSDFLREL